MLGQVAQATDDGNKVGNEDEPEMKKDEDSSPVPPDLYSGEGSSAKEATDAAPKEDAAKTQDEDFDDDDERDDI